MHSQASGMAGPFAIKSQHQTENRSHAKLAEDIPVEPFGGCDRAEFGSLFHFLLGSRDGLRSRSNREVQPTRVLQLPGGMLSSVDSLAAPLR